VEVFADYYNRYKRLYQYSIIAHECFGHAALLEQARFYADPPEPSSYVQLALQKAKGKVQNADLEMGETLGEYRETIQMIKSPLKSLRKFLLDDKTRNLRLLLALAKKDKRGVNRLLGRTGKASAEAMTSTWLELRYGLRPLVSLVQDVVEKVNSKKYAFYDPDKIRSARSSLSFSSKQALNDLEVNYVAYGIRGSAVAEHSITAMASVQYRQDREQGILDQLGLTPRFLPETLWNLTRLSFVVDWLFTIGPWLATLRVNPGCNVLGNTGGIRVKTKITLTSLEARVSSGNGAWSAVSCPSSSITLDTYTRECQVAMSYLPHFTWGRTLDLFKAIDSISLIWQFLPNKKGK
jgi:hypothetical protein